MPFENFQYPIKWKSYFVQYIEVTLHSKSNKISKQIQEQAEIINCECCQRRLGSIPKLTLLEDVEKKYSRYGPNVVLFFDSIKKIMVLLTIFSLIFTCYTLYANLQGNYCVNNPENCQFNHIVYKWSIYNIIDNEDALFVQLILWLAISIVIIAFNILMRLYFIKKYERINNQNITDADFSIIIRRLPEQTKISDIYKLIRQLIDDLNINDLKKSQLLKIRDVMMVYKATKAVEVQNQNKEKFKKAIKKGQAKDFIRQKAPQEKEFAKVAIVRFQSIHANEVISIKTPLIQRVIHYFFPFFNPRTKYTVRGKRVSIQQAPEPTDIIWGHFGYSESGKIKRKLLFFFLSLLVLCASCGALFGLSKANDALTDEQGQVPVYFSIIITLFTFIFNFVIRKILTIATKYQRLDNVTQENIEDMQKNIIYQSINLGFFTLFIPFLVKLPDIRQGTKSLSLPYVIFISSITQSFIAPTTNFILTYIGLIPQIKKFLVKHKFMFITQTEANILIQGPRIDFSNNYVKLAKIVWFSCLFSIINPICLPISVIGLIVYYIYQKILLNKKYVIPQYSGSRINSEFIDLLDFTPLLISLFNIFLHYMTADIFQTQLPQRIKTILFVNLGIGILNCLISWSDVLNFFDFKIKASHNYVYDDIKDKLETTYERQDPYLYYSSNNKNNQIRDARWKKQQKLDQLSKLKSALFSQRNMLTTTIEPSIAKDNSIRK